MSRRYVPTKPEADALKRRGWTVNDHGLWLRSGDSGNGWTYRDALREADRDDRNRKRDEDSHE